MKQLKNSIIIENCKIGINSLSEKDTKWKADGNYHAMIMLEKTSKEYEKVMKYIEGKLKEKNMTLEYEQNRDKSPICKNKRDGDIIAKKYADEGKKNEKGELMGQWLKGYFNLKITTEKDYNVVDMEKKPLNKKEVNWSGATVNIHCSPYVYHNNFGTGLKIILNNIQVVESYQTDSLEDAFGSPESPEFNPNDVDDDELPF